MRGAGDIIAALIAGGPAQDMDDYRDGAAVVERYLHHLGAAPVNLEQLIVVDRIADFLADDGDWEARADRGWSPAVRTDLGARAAAIKGLPHWREQALAGLSSDDTVVFAVAEQAARIAGIDTWSHHFERLEAGRGDGWYHVMRTQDAARIDRVLALAESRLPRLPDLQLDYLLQELSRAPGKGWPIIRAGLQSPVVRNRHMAIRALAAWEREAWPADADPVLAEARDKEPRDDVRTAFASLLAGEPLD